MTRLAVLLLCLLAALPVLSPSAGAVRPGEMLDDPALEARAREISKELRCLVCQNQSIDDSNADLAHDLRVIVRQRLKAGDSNEQVIDFVVERYGDFVLLRPPFKASTLLLWAGPAILLLAGGTGIAIWFRRRRNAAGPDALSPEEERRLQELLQSDPPARDRAGPLPLPTTHREYPAGGREGERAGAAFEDRPPQAEEPR